MTEQEFGHISNRIRGKLVGLARRFNRASGLNGEAEDVVQEALITLWRLFEKGYPIRDAEALAVKITKNLCVERYRKRHIRFQPIAGDPVEGSLSAAHRVEDKDNETIRRILYKGLTESQRKFLTLRGDHGMSLDEIAAVTGRPKASIKVAISTARKEILEQLKKIQ